MRWAMVLGLMVMVGALEFVTHGGQSVALEEAVEGRAAIAETSSSGLATDTAEHMEQRPRADEEDPTPATLQEGVQVKARENRVSLFLGEIL